MSQSIAERRSRALSSAAALGLMGSLMVTVILHKPPFWAMGVGTAVASQCAVARLRPVAGPAGHPTRYGKVAGFALAGLSRVLNVLVLIALINAMTAVWFSSGTIQGLVYYGLRVVRPRYVALAGLALSTLLCTLIGSSVGTVATVGVAIMGIARISAWVLLPALLVVVLAVHRVPVRVCLAIGLAVGGAVAVVYQHETVSVVARTALLGYRAAGAGPQISSLLQSGGLRGATNMLLLLVFAGMYTGIMELSGMMGDVSGGLVSRLHSRRSFLAGAMGVSVLSAALASNQAMAVIIPAGAMEGKRKELGVSSEEFGGVLTDSGVAAAGVIPWNVMAVMCSEALQVPPLAFAPYTVLVCGPCRSPLCGA